MDKKDCYYLGYISKTVGFRGDLVLTLDTDEAHHYQNLESVYVEINRKLVPFFLERIVNSKNNHIRVKLEGIGSDKEASELLKKSLYLPLEQLPNLSGKKFYFHEVIGFEVVDDQFGSCGIIEDVTNTTTNPVFQIQKEGKEILIPVHDDFIRHVDRKHKRIHVSTPPGLIELYLGS